MDPCNADHLIQQIRHWLACQNIGTWSDATRTQYRADCRRLLNDRTPDEVITALKDTRSKNTYYKRRAAVIFGLTELLQHWVSEYENAQSHQDNSLARGCTQHLQSALELVIKLADMAGECPLKAPQKRHSKRQDLAGLPQDWRQQIADRLRHGESKYYLPFIAEAITGCRPAELQKGILARSGDGHLTIAIKGAKVDAAKGQKWRILRYDLTDPHPLVASLAQEIALIGGEIRIAIENPRNWSTALRRVGQTLWPQHKKHITPYCLRHDAASNFKASSLNSDEIAQALGHATNKTQKRYGQKQMSRGGRGVAPTQVAAERPIRHVTQDFTASPRSSAK